MRLLCRLGIHKWGNWGDKYSLPNATFLFEFQQRKCKCCRYVQERIVQ